MPNDKYILLTIWSHIGRLYTYGCEYHASVTYETSLNSLTIYLDLSKKTDTKYISVPARLMRGIFPDFSLGNHGRLENNARCMNVVMRKIGEQRYCVVLERSEEFYRAHRDGRSRTLDMLRGETYDA